VFFRCLLLALYLFSPFLSNAQTREIDSLRQIIHLHNRDTSELSARIHLIYILTRVGKNDIAMREARDAARLADSLNSAFWLSSAYTYLVHLHQETGQIDSARQYLAKAEALARSNKGNMKTLVNFLRSAGLFYKNQGEYKEALKYMLESVEVWDKRGEFLAGQFLNLGNVYINLGDFKNAADYHLRALRTFEEINNTRGQAYCLQSLGSDFQSMKQYTTAKTYFERALKLKEQLKDDRGKLTSLLSLGDVHKDLEEYKKATEYYDDGLAMSTRMNAKGMQAHIWYHKGILSLRMNNLAQARKSLESSIALASQVQDSVLYAKARSEMIGLDLTEKEESAHVESHLLTGLSTVIRTGDRRQEVTEYARLSDYYANKKEFDKALLYLEKYHALRDSIEGQEVVLQIKELEEKYNSEKKEREIELLKAESELKALEVERQRAITMAVVIALISLTVIGGILVNRYRVLQRTKRQLEVEKMRNDIARDLHDDLGSALSSINIMSQMALRNGASSNTTYFQRISEQSARMMENMSDIVWSIKPGNDGLEQFVVRMKEFASEILEPKNITYRFHENGAMPEVKLDAAKRKNLFLVFKEAVNNAAKYSKAQNVDIKLSVVNGTLTLLVRDDGVGYDYSTIRPGNGLRNIEERAQTMQGKAMTNSSPENGTEIIIEIPVT
jgi:two-component system sensor histidine kinase UhpB